MSDYKERLTANANDFDTIVMGMLDEIERFNSLKDPITNLAPEQKKEFDDITQELMRFMAKNFHPHMHIIINSSHAELSEGVFINQINSES